MSKLLEIFGKAITVDTAELIWHWLDTVIKTRRDVQRLQARQLMDIITLATERKDEAAEKQLKLYLLENPGCIYGRMAAAAICLSKAMLSEAIEQLNSVYMREPSNTMALYALGHCYERLGKQAEAIEFYQDCVKFKSYLQLPRQRLAAIYLKNNQLKRAIREYELLKREYPDDTSSLVILGYLYIADQDYSHAIDTFNSAILIHPDNFNTGDERVEHFIRSGMLQEAYQLLEQLLEQEPQRADLWVTEAEVLAMLGAEAEAVTRYQHALRLCPDFIEARIKLGIRYLQMNWPRLAAQQFNQAAESNDRVVDAYIGLATAEKLAGRESEALGILSLAAAIQLNSCILIAKTAALHYKARTGKSFQSDQAFAGEVEVEEPGEQDNALAQVIASHRRQLQQQPQDPDLYYRMGILLMADNRFSDASTAFQKALQINPTHTRARTKLAICLYEINKKDQSLQQLSESVKLTDEMLELHYQTALLYCDRIRFASSLLNLERYLEENYTLTDAVVNVSVVLQNLGLLDRAEQMWDKLTETTEKAAETSYGV